MKLFIDTGNIKDIQALVALGIIDGITTNPTLLSREPGDYRENLKDTYLIPERCNQYCGGPAQCLLRTNRGNI